MKIVFSPCVACRHCKCRLPSPTFYVFLLFFKHSQNSKIYPLLVISFLNFLFYIGVYLINNVVIVLGEQQRDSAIHTHGSILPQTPLPSRLPHNMEQSSRCYTVSPCWLSILSIAVCTYPSLTP